MKESRGAGVNERKKIQEDVFNQILYPYKGLEYLMIAIKENNS